ncbi:MAG: hypothetical protein ACQR33_04140 [Candidatus Saccharibacteria bacterium]
MARLPIPGSDAGAWGSVLNDFLQQAHATDGALKGDSVGATQLQTSSVGSAHLQSGSVGTPALANGAVTASKLADGTISSSKMAPASITADKLDPSLGLSDSLRSLLIFYAAPTIINAKYDLDYAAGTLSRYDDVVLGTGLEDPASTYHADTASIIAKVAALSPSTVIWGYIDTGVTTGNFSLATLQTQIDQWVAMGAKGIFLDVFGYDFHVSRTRQNAILDYVHSKGIGSIMNVFNADEALGSQVDATYNPSGTATHANSSDVLLLESWVCNSDAYANPFYATFSDIKTRGDLARTYRESLGVRIFAINIMAQSGTSENVLDGYRGMTEALARVWRLDGSGLAASSYGATGPDVGIVNARFNKIPPSPYRPTAPYTLNGGWTEVIAADLGITVDFDPGTSTFTWTRA